MGQNSWWKPGQGDSARRNRENKEQWYRFVLELWKKSRNKRLKFEERCVFSFRYEWSLTVIERAERVEWTGYRNSETRRVTIVGPFVSNGSCFPVIRRIGNIYRRGVVWDGSVPPWETRSPANEKLCSMASGGYDCGRAQKKNKKKINVITSRVPWCTNTMKQ